MQINKTKKTGLDGFKIKVNTAVQPIKNKNISTQFKPQAAKIQKISSLESKRPQLSDKNIFKTSRSNLINGPLSSVNQKLSKVKRNKNPVKPTGFYNLPHSRFKRILFYLNPKNFFKNLFSLRGLVLMLKLSAIAFLVGGLTVVGVFAYYRKDLSKLKPDEIAAHIKNSGVKYYDRTGQVLLWEQKGEKDRTVVESGDISDAMKHAMVATEDKNFYEHKGFDTKGIARAATTGNGGGSTITQQLVKNELLTSEHSISRKIKELILAIEVERTYTKDQILTLYLNSAPFGGTATGIEAGAHRYFGPTVAAKDLTLEQSLLLAAIPQLPSRYDPYSDYYKRDYLAARMKYALNNMVELKYVTKEQADVIDVEKIIDSVQAKELAIKGQYDNIKAPHFVLEVKKQLDAIYGADNVANGGYIVTTTLDWDLQQVADAAVSDNMKFVEAGSGDNAALVTTDVNTAQILAMVGSRDFTYPGYGQYNEALEPRQPGSSLKPFVYSKLFERSDYGAGSILMDTPKSWPGLGENGGTYTPQNADKQYFGAITIREALNQSRNLPALKAIEIAGVDNTIQLANEMGDLSLCTTCSYSIAAALGAGEVKLAEHTNAYASLARGGIYKEQSYILKVEKSSGEILQEWKESNGERKLNEEIAWIMNDILKDDAARARVFGRNNAQINVSGLITAAKTGTSNGNKEGWMMGYTPKIVTGVLVDRRDHNEMYGFTINQTGPIWTQFMRNAYKVKGWTSEDFGPKPSGVQKLTVAGKTDWFPSWYKKPAEVPSKDFKVDKVSKKLATTCTPVTAVEIVKGIPSQVGDKPTDIDYKVEGYDLKSEDDIHKCTDVPASINASSQANNQPKGYNFDVQLTQGTFAMTTLEIYIDSALAETVAITGNSYAFSHKFTQDGSHQVKFKIIDQGLYTNESTLNINVDSTNSPNP